MAVRVLQGRAGRNGGPRSEDNFILLLMVERDRVIVDDLGVVGIPGVVEGWRTFDAEGDGSTNHLMSGCRVKNLQWAFVVIRKQLTSTRLMSQKSNGRVDSLLSWRGRKSKCMQ